MWWGHHGAWFCPFGLFIFIILIFVVVRFFTFRNCRVGWRGRFPDEADAILRKRFANGEIDEAEYEKLRDALKK